MRLTLKNSASGYQPKVINLPHLPQPLNIGIVFLFANNYVSIIIKQIETLPSTCNMIKTAYNVIYHIKLKYSAKFAKTFFLNTNLSQLSSSKSFKTANFNQD